MSEYPNRRRENLMLDSLKSRRTYFTLCERRPGKLWTIEFGDFSNQVVAQERRDRKNGFDFERGTEYRIIETADEQQASIDAAVAKLNECGPSIDPRRGNFVRAAMKGCAQMCTQYGARTEVTQKGFVVKFPDNTEMQFDVLEL